MLLILTGYGEYAAYSLALRHRTLWFSCGGIPLPEPPPDWRRAEDASLQVISEPWFGGMAALAERLLYPDLPPLQLRIPNLDCLRYDVPYEKSPAPADFDPVTLEVTRKIARRELTIDLVVIASGSHLFDTILARVAAGAGANGHWGPRSGQLIRAIACDAFSRLTWNLTRAGLMVVVTAWTNDHGRPHLPKVLIRQASCVVEGGNDALVVTRSLCPAAAPGARFPLTDWSWLDQLPLGYRSDRT